MITEKKIVTAGIVDDDEIFTYGFKKLSVIKGLFDEIMNFSNGKEAIDYLLNPQNRNHLPDVLFVDINMPVMNGWEFNDAFDEIKSQLGKNIVIYNIGSSIDLEDIKRAKDNPVVTDYLLKPIDEICLTEIFTSLQNPTDMRRYN
ncbi:MULTISPECIES: response regulator [unclassified Mucilaginibacter]|uniref:response regulator n=1 Tax=unclassified Mucilaginibacter TaxID=2617802 RepID=UPI002AC96BF6|nr:MULTISPECIES: response regulator [unclassified Mucilaginibacter]MEB0260537.1 response regulator [Mucilaginibacter sp. 10I4]MEB0278107.1 response regulator [Mucilaginibacter sp. 10B2]MEB0301765.1 response regulator [Mucilaginibacter sp. 5C4]WPX23018.1 response regulator [Mucilaginibacter sp. 5C4]